MFTITPVDKRDNVSTPTTPPSNSSMSISPPPSSSNLFYISIDRVASPKPINTNPDSSSEPKGYQFGDTERINPLHFQPVKLEDGEVSNDSQSLLPPAPFTPARPAQIQVKVRNFEEAHNLREAEAKTNAPSSVPNHESPPRLQSDTRRNLDFLYHTLHYVYGQIRQQNPQANDDAATDWNTNDEEEEDDDSDDKDWRTPASTGPPQGNSTHPPSQWVCGEHPGIGWELNDPLTTNFYRVTIPDPTTSRLIVAPFVTYAIQRDRAEISATYGKGYPIHTRVLQPLPVTYYCPALTPDELTIFDSKAPFADAVNKVINEQFPLHLSAAVRRYQHFKEAQYTVQTTIRRLQEREQAFLEKAMCVLSEMENANILGRLYAHEEDIFHSLTANQVAAARFLRIQQSFDGFITESALNPRPNNYRNTRRGSSGAPLDPKFQTRWAEPITPEESEDPLREEADRIEDHLRSKLHERNRGRFIYPSTHASVRPTPRFNKLKDKTPFIHYHAGRCYNCHHRGHVRAQCPHSKLPRNRHARK